MASSFLKSTCARYAVAPSLSLTAAGNNIRDPDDFIMNQKEQQTNNKLSAILLMAAYTE
jgi:hypothetical protein